MLAQEARIRDPREGLTSLTPDESAKLKEVI